MNIPFAVEFHPWECSSRRRAQAGHVGTEFPSSLENAILTKGDFDNDSLLEHKSFGEHVGTADVILDK